MYDYCFLASLALSDLLQLARSGTVLLRHTAQLCRQSVRHSAVTDLRKLGRTKLGCPSVSIMSMPSCVKIGQLIQKLHTAW